MNKTKVEIYQEVLRDVSQNFQDTKKFINREFRKSAKVIYFSYVYKSLCL